MKRIGVIGTMVWDTIYGRGAETRPAEEWGGIAYALAGLEARLPGDWAIVPLIKVGRDLAGEANGFLDRLTKRSMAHRFVEVQEANNRVTLRYDGAVRTTEQMRGGVPPWTWGELGPLTRDLDALYVNFISGFECTLETSLQLRRGFSGPIYADLHSLLLAVRPDHRLTGDRVHPGDLLEQIADVVKRRQRTLGKGFAPRQQPDHRMERQE